jgi:hypothetical protein
MGRTLYPLYQAHSVLVAPLRVASELTADWIELAPSALRDSMPLRQLSAAGRVVVGAQLTHDRPDYGIEDIVLGGETVPVPAVRGGFDAIRITPPLPASGCRRAAESPSCRAAVRALRHDSEPYRAHTAA